MKKFLLLAVLTAFAAGPAQAKGLLLAWGACPHSAGASTSEIFECNGDGAHMLHGSFFTDAAVPGFVALDGTIDLYMIGQTNVPAFWHFESGGCDDGALALSAARPATGCASSVASNSLCGVGGTGCTPFITAYAPGFGGANVARLLFTLARDSSNPVPLAASTVHFAMQFTIYENNAPGVAGGRNCAGCNQTVRIFWTDAILYAPTGEVAHLFATDAGSAAAVCANAATCDIVPAKNRTWGQLKSLYR